jgi:hypothetical protein
VNGGGPDHGDSSQPARSGNKERNIAGGRGRGNLAMMSSHFTDGKVI